LCGEAASNKAVLAEEFKRGKSYCVEKPLRIKDQTKLPSKISILDAECRRKNDFLLNVWVRPSSGSEQNCAVLYYEISV
jgi:hypothetical protein